MKLATLFVALATTSVSFLSALARPAFPLEARASSPLPSHLQSSGTFYRAVTGAELAHLNDIYHVGRHPASHSPTPGDFSPHGGLYVFEDINEAKTWGSCWAKVQPKKEKRYWYLITFHYTPNNSLTKKSFATGSTAWRTFVDGCYHGTATNYDIVEGPVSVGHGARMQPYLNTAGHMLWQASFNSPSALATLTITNIQKFDEGAANTRQCCTGCNIG